MGNEALKDEFTDYECGHCGEMVGLVDVNFDGEIRTLCKKCIRKILEWI